MDEPDHARSPLIPTAWDRPGDDPIFALNAEARKRAQDGRPVINATLGALLEDDGSLAVMPVVAEAYGRVSWTQAAAYAPIAGDASFQRGVTLDLFAGAPDLHDQAAAVATPGGSGALCLAIANFVEPGQEVLTAAHYWGPYQTLCDQGGRRLRTFPTFNAAGRFHAEALRAALVSSAAAAGRVLLLLNTPCHNPTGYSLDAGEWDEVIDAVEQAARHGAVTVVLDLAYVRFGAAPLEALHAPIRRLQRSSLVLIAWSASKSFAQYGARVGAAVVVHPDAGLRRRAVNAMAYSCRGTWSNCNHHGLLAIGELLNDAQLRARADAERGRLKGLLDARAAAWNRNAGAAGLRFPRYDGGFFVTVFVDGDVGQAAARLRARDVFVVPTCGSLRVGLCATPADRVPALVEALAACCGAPA